MNINININTIANLATGFIEAYYWCVLCDTFMKRYLKLPKYVYIICVVCLGVNFKYCVNLHYGVE